MLFRWGEALIPGAFPQNSQSGSPVKTWIPGEGHLPRRSLACVLYTPSTAAGATRAKAVPMGIHVLTGRPLCQYMDEKAYDMGIITLIFTSSFIVVISLKIVSHM